MADISGEAQSWLVTIGASVLTAIGGFILALLNRGPALQSLTDQRLKMLIEGQDKHIDELRSEIERLRTEIESLRQSQDKTRIETRENICAMRGACKEFAPVET